MVRGLLALKGPRVQDDAKHIRNKPAFWVRVLNPKSREKWKKSFFRLRFWAVLALFCGVFSFFAGAVVLFARGVLILRGGMSFIISPGRVLGSTPG